MLSTSDQILPARIRKSLKKLGADISIARKKRRLTVGMMAERIGVAKSTYLRVEKGHPRVGMGIYAMSLFVLGFDGILGDLIDSKKDEQGILLEEERLPKRIRVKKSPRGL